MKRVFRINTHNLLRLTGRFLVALLAATLLGSIIQTQFNLLALQALDVAMPLSVRVATTLLDIVNFGPIYALIVGASLLLSLPVAVWLGGIASPRWRTPIYAVVAGMGLWLLLSVVDSLAPMPTLIAATRTGAGTLAMLTSAGLGGWVFARLNGCDPATASSRAGLPLILALGLFGAASPQDAHADYTDDKPYRIETWTEGLEFPWALVFLPDGQALVSERPGRLRMLAADGQLHPEPLAELPEIFTADQAGLMDIILAPDFETSRAIYFSYACGTQRVNNTCLARARLVEHRLENLREIFRAQPAKRGASHYGGRMAWLPDGTLVLTLGDGFDYREHAQRLGDHLGKIVRLNADGSAPEDNPFAGREGAVPEIYSYGHRNVQGIIYDSVNDRLLSHEHGPRGGDELNRIVAGENYGWPVATHGVDYNRARVTPYTRMSGMRSPLLHWTPAIAPSGMTLYRGELFPQWQGDLFVSALVAKEIRRVRLNGDEVVEEQGLFGELEERLRDVRTGPDGALYLLTDSERGRILRVVPR